MQLITIALTLGDNVLQEAVLAMQKRSVVKNLR